MIFYRKITPIKAMTFDIDDTFYNNWPYIKEAEQALTHYIADQYPSLGHITWADRLAAKEKVLTQRPEIAFDMCKLRLATLEFLFSDLGLNPIEASKTAQDCFAYFYFKRSDFTINPEYHSTMSVLASKIPLIAITNGNVNMQQIGLAQYFTGVYHASVEYKAKPHPDMFIAAQQDLLVSMQDILHIGDCPINDVWGAYKMGMQTAWYADDREMSINQEKFRVLPSVQLTNLHELVDLI
ncbi:HAD-IA family hydrolase [Opacimonas viscosa]|uniref:HAD-IA family hydrolase n=1 Tax=Opacimonas viscosa TaxID=2961944 RepID=A0AA42BKW7_9ALTE|nr:HAD-IA family hydrolase [Opacimonas viscosa]MCP3428228.1 HAD-IA family hydrolase [Opacimonas viscosa]